MCVAFVLFASCADVPPLTDGPFVGHVDSRSIHVYARAAQLGVIQAALASEGLTRTLSANAEAANDAMVHFRFEDLEPERDYSLCISSADGSQTAARSIRTPSATATSQTLAFASCAHDLHYPHQAIWQRLQEARIDGLVLLGDTPYIDSTVLSTQRARRRAFHRVPELATLLARVPVWTTWDDHDFGKNDVDGRLKGKEFSRQALLEWSALATAGNGTAGIYTSLRRGPLEVFLLDTRTFSNTENGADGLPSLLGETQWRWLRAGLLQSDAPFKLIASSMVWNGAVRPLKTDMWTNWQHERNRLWSFIGSEGIEGVVLLSGDVHRTRVFAHSCEALSGYRLHEFVTSPAANNVHEAAKQPHPDLLFDVGVNEAALIVEVDAATPDGLSVRSIGARGNTLREDRLNTSDLVRGAGEPLRSAFVDGQRRVVRGGELQLLVDTHAFASITALYSPGRRNLLAQHWSVGRDVVAATEREEVAWSSGSLRWSAAGPWTVVLVEQHVGNGAQDAPVLPPLQLALENSHSVITPAALTVCGELRGRKVGLSILALNDARVLPAPLLRDGAIHFPKVQAATSSADTSTQRYVCYALVLHSRIPTASEFAALLAH